jgi:O-antigen/teichoic acid export membrane protein
MVVIPLTFSFIAESIGWMLGLGIDLSKKTHFAIINYLLGICATLAGVLFLIPLLGITGAAYGVLIGSIVKAVCYYFFGHKVYPMKLPLFRPAFMFFSSIITLLIVHYTYHFSTLIGWLFTFGMFFMLLFVFWKIGITAHERSVLLKGLLQFRKGNKLFPAIPCD